MSLDGSVLEYERPGGEDTRKLASHGGLTPSEMEVPLIVL